MIPGWVTWWVNVNLDRLPQKRVTYREPTQTTVTAKGGSTMSGHYEYEPEEWAERVDMFADPGGHSALRRANKSNPRNLPCPMCGWPNRLTPADRDKGYQCDSCANAQEQGMDINYYEGG
jgi:hypothetical protein